MSGLRILHLARDIRLTDRPRTGGERRLAEIREHLDRAAVPVLAYGAPGGGDSGMRATDSRAHSAWRSLPMPLRGARRDLMRLFAALVFVLRALPGIRRFRPTVVYERAAYFDPAGLILARLLRLPLVLELHGDLAADAAAYYRSPLERLGRAFEARRYHAADRVIVVSRGLADQLEEVGVDADRIVVVPNGVTVSEPVLNGGSVRESWGAGDRRIVGWIGHLMPWQLPAFDHLVDALETLNDRFPLALVIVAPLTEAIAGPLEQLRSRATFPVVLAGAADGSRADAAVAAFDVGVVPVARPYDLPVKVFQYGALGVPAVVPSTVSTRELDGGRGLLYLFDAGDIASAVARAFDDPSAAQRFREVVLREHSWGAVVDHVMDVCLAAIRGRRRTSRQVS